MDEIKYLKYDNRLKERARELRKNETEAEKLFWKEIISNKKFLGYKFTRQKMINYFIVDFYCSELMLAIEIDGGCHNDKIEYDDERTIELNKLGIKVIRFTNQEVFNDLDTINYKLKNYLNL